MPKVVVLAAFIAVSGAPAFAQINGGLVTVNISGIRVELEDLLDAVVTVDQVQVPIGVAANVCSQITAAILADQLASGGSPNCTADSASRALAQFVQRQNQ
jgi:hypothetical protein